MPQSKEDRIRAQYKGMKRRSRGEGGTTSPLYMRLAKQWKMSCYDIKVILGKVNEDDPDEAQQARQLLHEIKRTM